MNWRHTVQIKDLLTPSCVTPAKAQAIGKVVAQRLQGSPFAHWRSHAASFTDVLDQDDFNECMSNLYDSADVERIWIA